MKHSKQFISTLLAGAMVLSLAACNNNKQDADNTTYTETAHGYGGDVVATVTLDQTGKVVGLEVTADQETASIGGAAVEPMVNAILAAGTPKVDGVAGATLTSNAIKTAVQAALVSAGFAEAPGEVAYTAGTYEGEAMGRGGLIHATVEVSDSQILSIQVTGEDETAGIADLPLSQLPQDIITYQSLGVDAVTGATLTSYGVINAVSNALEQSGVDLAALRAVSAEKSWEPIGDQTTQVVVVGGGISGLTAALAAADEGAQVILLEKMSYLGGSLLVSAGGFVFVDSEMKTIEADDSAERMIAWAKDLHSGAEREPNYDFMAYALRQGGQAIDWLMRDHELPFFFFNSADTPRAIYGNGGGAGYATAMEELLTQAGVTILKNSAADSIIMENGQAAGVTVKYPGGDYAVHADKVIIATGGDTRDVETLTRYTPGMANIKYYDQTNVGNTGDGYDMLRAVGAQMADGLYLKSAFPEVWEGFRFTWRTDPNVTTLMVVDDTGARFAAEAKTISNDRSYLNWEMIEHGSEAYWAIYDGANIPEDLKARFDEHVDENNRDIVFYAETIEELAQKAGMDEATFTAAFNKYQAAVQAGVDEEFGKPASALVPYVTDQGFYAARLTAATWGTFGGAITDRQFHVLDTEGNIIPNLFGAGEVAGSEFFGNYYMGGFSLGLYAGAARTAALTAVEELNVQ